MAYRLIPLALLGLARLTAALPARGNTLLDLEVADDTQSVGSYIREVRAAPVSSLPLYLSPFCDYINTVR